MASENNFYISFWKIVASVLCVLIASISSCTIGESYLVSEVIKKGVDPIKATCAITTGKSGYAICIQAASK